MVIISSHIVGMLRLKGGRGAPAGPRSPLNTGRLAPRCSFLQTAPSDDGMKRSTHFHASTPRFSGRVSWQPGSSLFVRVHDAKLLCFSFGLEFATFASAILCSTVHLQLRVLRRIVFSSDEILRPILFLGSPACFFGACLSFRIDFFSAAFFSGFTSASGEV